MSNTPLPPGAASPARSSTASPDGSRQRLLALLRDPRKLRTYRRRGRLAVLTATGSVQNACAAVASQPLLELALLGRPLLSAQALADELEGRALAQRIAAPSAVQPGDLIVCADLNHNGRADHVWWALSAPDAMLHALCFDNQGRLTHRRNLAAGPRTPMAYALRLKDSCQLPAVSCQLQ